IGIDGLIIPDLPIDIYAEEYQSVFEKYGLKNTFLITPQTSEIRIRYIDSVSDGFIYMVSSAAVTGSQRDFGESQQNYFRKIANMNLRNPQIVGFGISNQTTFNQATEFAKGAIIGSAFINNLNQTGTSGISGFINSILTS
ncbi:MAG TPA: tryptophan synthase subunit alpha, partial [Flavobacterium sp.]|nr:tryptophan synthase subunit alpha [Flavobacterium sp.]